MKIIFYDVEHGNCCHIITPFNKHILIDVGSKKSSSIVEFIKHKYFPEQDGRIDQLIITHPHEDHIYDLPKLKSILPPRALLRPKNAFDISPSSNNLTHIEIASIANSMNKEYNVPVPLGKAPIDSAINGGVDFKCIFPNPEWTDRNDLNSFSPVIVVSYKHFKFVITGDNPSSILQKMMDENYNSIKESIGGSHILLAPHHGRENGFCHDFFACVNPILTVVSDKQIEHDTQEYTSDYYKSRGTLVNGTWRYVLTTRCDGTIAFDVGEGDPFITIGREGY